MALSEKERWVLGVVGSIASLGVGYLIWRHEAALTQAQNAQNAATTQANDQQYADQLEQALQVGGGVQASAGGTSAGGYIDGSSNGSTITPTGGSGGDSELAAILAAFFPGGTSTNSGNGSTPTGVASAPSQPVPIGNRPVATPQLPVQGIQDQTLSNPSPAGTIVVTGGPKPAQGLQKYIN